MHYYPLAAGNRWEYKQKNGNTYSNDVTGISGNLVTMKNSALPDPSHVKIENGAMYNELIQKDNFQLWLKDNFQKGETWEAGYVVNGLDSLMVLTVKETGITKEVEGKHYSDVIMIEAESKIKMNGNLMSLNYFTQYYYAKGVGLILTASSDGDTHSLTSYQLH